MNDESAVCTRNFAAWVAIDWADRKHVWALREAGSGRTERGEIEHTPEAVEVWAASLAQRFPSQRIAVALEQARGALLFMLMKYDHLVLYPVHPKTIAKYRQAFYPSGSKDDPRDADLLLELLSQHRDRLRCLEPDTVETRRLQFLVEERRAMVEEKTRFTNRLTSRLKLFFPQMVTWFQGELDTSLVGALLRRWPTLDHLQTARPATLREFFWQNHCRNRELIEQRIEQIRRAHPATGDAAVMGAGVASVRILLPLIRTLRQGIDDLGRQIEELTAAHPDFPIFHSLPGAGAALVPRLIAAFGTNRQRFDSAEQVQCYSGIAPVTERSGNSLWVHFRLACPKFLRQTFHEWASHSRRWSPWAAAFYQQQRAKGKSHQAAVRALAFKWIRIVFRCWQQRTLYSEDRYQRQLLLRASRKPAVAAPPPAPASITPSQWKNCAGFFRFAGGTS